MWLFGNFYLSQPTEKQVAGVVQEGARLGFNHNAVGLTQQQPTSDQLQGWTVDHTRIKLGQGRRTFASASKAILAWQQFNLPWSFVRCKGDAHEGQLVAVVAQTLFAWTCNPLKVVYLERNEHVKLPHYTCNLQHRVISRSAARNTNGKRVWYAHSTLTGHQLAGEERFAVEWNKADDSVWYEIFTLSKPATPLAFLTYPLVRHYQRKFAADSVKYMKDLQQLTTQ